MLAALGSTNPVKLSAARAVLQRIYGESIEVLAVSVDPGVPNQPWGDSETRRGAINRAVAAQARSDATWGLGLEGGILELPDGDGELYTSAWCAVVDTGGILGIAGGANMLLPPDVAAALRSGHELGSAIDKLVGQHDTRSHKGAIGVLCQGWTDRQRAFEQVLTLAFAPILSPQYYAKVNRE